MMLTQRFDFIITDGSSQSRLIKPLGHPTMM